MAIELIVESACAGHAETERTLRENEPGEIKPRSDEIISSEPKSFGSEETISVDRPIQYQGGLVESRQFHGEPATGAILRH